MIKKILDKQIVKFIFVGILNTIVGYGTYSLLIYLNLNYIIANTISTIVGIINSYILNRKITFKESKVNNKTPFKFVSIYFISYIVGNINLFILIKKLNVNEYFAGLFNILVTTIISYFGHKYFSFKEVKK